MVGDKRQMIKVKDFKFTIMFKLHIQYVVRDISEIPEPKIELHTTVNKPL